MIPISKNNGTTLSLTGIIAVLLLLFLFSLLGNPLLLNILNLTKDNAAVLFISRLFYWFVLILLWLYAVKIEKQGLMIWQERRYKITGYVLSLIVLFGILFAGLLVINVIYTLTGSSKTSSRLLEIVAILRGHNMLLVFTALTAGIVEELIFRGYIQPRLELLFKNPHLSIIVSSILFGLLHYRYGTVINVIGPVFISLVFGYYYWRYRNIKVLILCHFLWDVLSLYLLLKKYH